MTILVLSETEALEASVREAVGDAARATTAPLSVGIGASGDEVEVVIIDGAEDEQQAFDLARQFDDHRPEVTVVLHLHASADAMATAMQLGVRDVLVPGSDSDRVREVVKRALEVAEKRHHAMRAVEPGERHRLIMVLSPKGGAGKTTVASNLAVGLARRAPKEVVLVDGDLQFGDVGNALRLIAESSIRDAIVGGLKDVTEVKVHLTPHRSGLYALCAPEIPGVADEITAQAYARTITLLGQEFRYVVVDTDPGLGERTLTAMDHATDFVFVAATDVASVRGLRKTIDALDRIGMTSARRHFVLNRSDAKVGLDVDDIAATIGMEPDVLLPSSRSLPVSMNQGTPVLELDDDGPAVAPLWRLVDRFEADPNATNSTEHKRSGGFFGGADVRLGDRLKQADGDEARDAPTPEPVRVDPYLRLKGKVSAALMETLASRPNNADMSDNELLDLARDTLSEIMNAEDVPLSTDEKVRLIDEISADVIGYGPITPFLEDPDVTEVMCNGTDGVWIERRGMLEETEVRFTSDQALRRVIDRIVAAIGRRVDESSPMVDARLPDGSRVNAVIPPLAVDGPSLTIRKFSKMVLAAEDYVRTGSATEPLMEFLSTCVAGKLNILVSGGTGTGKTTLLNVLSNFIPEGERIVTIEDAVELRLNMRHVVRLESRPPNVEGRGEVTIRDLVRNALRMRPDRIIVGECRGGEALDMLQAMNTGHEGSLGTLHANTPRDALSRMETMVLMAGLDLPMRAIREQIASAIDLIVHISRLRDGTRRITKVVEIVGMENDTITANSLFDFDYAAGIDENGSFLGRPQATGIRPFFSDQLAEQGFQLPKELFSEASPSLVEEALSATRRHR